MRRLDQHKNHPRVIDAVRDLKVPWVQDTSLHLAPNATYDTALANAVRLFRRLQDIQIVFQPWDGIWEGGVTTVDERLALSRALPYCFSAVDAVATFLPTLTSITFDGIRSLEDHGLVLDVLRQNPQIKKVDLSYRMDWAVIVVIRTGNAEAVQSRNLWRLLGRSEALTHLRMTCMPAKDLSNAPDVNWRPDVWLPTLRSLDLCRVPVSQELLQAIFARSSQCLSLAFDEQAIPLLARIKPPPFPDLRYLTLAGLEAADCLQALAFFKSPPIHTLDLSLPREANDFLRQYLEGRNKHLRVLTVILSSTDSASLEEHPTFVEKYAQAGVQLIFRTVG